MRKETMECIIDAIALNDNTCQTYDLTRKDLYGDMTEAEQVEAIYIDIIQIAETYTGYTSAIRFDGKKAIMKEIRKRMYDRQMFPYLNR